jgi:DNA mismatch repair protein MutL
MQAYHTMLPINRYPMVVLEIGMHPELVDVNVHPSKMEVRFSKETELKEFVEGVIKAELSGHIHIPSTPSERSKPLFVQERIAFHRPEPETGGDRQPAQDRKDPSFGGARDYNGSPSFRRSEQDMPDPVIPKDATERLYTPSDRLSSGFTAKELPGYYAEAAPAAEAAAPQMRQPFNSAAPNSDRNDPSIGYPSEARSLPSDTAGQGFPELSWIGQLHGTYFVAQNENGLYLIDQHAAHERIHYEYYVRKFGQPHKMSQQLLVPLTLEFTAGDAGILRSRLSLFEEAGVELESFGPNSFLVRAYPEWFPKGDEAAVIEEMAEWILSEKKTVDIGKLREKSAIMCSCKASIKANHRMTREEGEVLLRRLSECEQPYTCPHGRPIVVHISTYELEKMFKRVMS